MLLWLGGVLSPCACASRGPGVDLATEDAVSGELVEVWAGDGIRVPPPDVGVADQGGDEAFSDGGGQEASDLFFDLEEEQTGADGTCCFDGGQDGAEDSGDLPGEQDTVLPEPVPPAEVTLDPFGGMEALHVADGTGYFTTGLLGDRAWLVDPAGNAFFSLGVQAVGFGSLSSPALGYAPGTLAQYASWAAEYPNTGEIPAAVATAQVTALHEAGFNSVGGWSGGIWSSSAFKLPYTVSLGFAGGVQGVAHAVPAVSEGGFPDVFHPDFSTACLEYAQQAVPAECVEDPLNIGYYLDNELRWWGRGYFVESKTWTLADDFIDEAAGTPAKEAVVAYFEQRYGGDVEAFNVAYGLALASFDDLGGVSGLPLDPADPVHVEDREGLIRLIAEAYFSAANDGLKSVDPNHLNLCCRVASVAPGPVFEMAGTYCDVVTINDYYTQSDLVTDMALGGLPEDRWAAMSGLAFAGGGPRPFILTEWGERADDSGLPNTYGAGKVVATQQERAEYYQWSLEWLMDREVDGIGYVSGAHWFMHTDEPATGRFDGEDGNYGVVSIRGERYRWLWAAMAASNQALLSRLAAGVIPTLLGPPQKNEVEGTVVQGGVHLEFPAVPLVDSYRISVLSHPAGLENRVKGGPPTDVVPAGDCQPGGSGCQKVKVDVSTVGTGQGMVWLAVECQSLDLLPFGATVVGPFETQDVAVTSNGPVMGCETLSTVAVDNSVPQPNDASGQSYSELVESFLGADSGQALELELVPSSLGFVKAGGSGEVAATLSLPELLEVPAGSALEVFVLPSHVMDTSGTLRASTRFVRIQGIGEGGGLLVDWDLAPLELAPGVSSKVTLPVDETLQLHALRFVVPLSTPGLPMDQVVRITLDQILVGP